MTVSCSDNDKGAHNTVALTVILVPLPCETDDIMVVNPTQTLRSNRYLTIISKSTAKAIDNNYTDYLASSTPASPQVAWNKGYTDYRIAVV